VQLCFVHFSVVFYVIRVVYKLDFMLDINKHLTNDEQWKRTSSSDRKICFRESIYFPSTIVASVKGLYLRCAGQLHFLE